MSLDAARFRRAGLTIESADFERLVIEAVERVLPTRAGECAPGALRGGASFL
jgi:hypothetical protein